MHLFCATIYLITVNVNQFRVDVIVTNKTNKIHSKITRLTSNEQAL